MERKPLENDKRSLKVEESGKKTKRFPENLCFCCFKVFVIFEVGITKRWFTLSALRNHRTSILMNIQ